MKMMTIILAAFLFSYYFIEIALFPNAIKRALKIPYTQRIKPFDCVTCLSVWIAVLLWFAPHYVTDFTATVFGAGFIGNFFNFKK